MSNGDSDSKELAIRENGLSNLIGDRINVLVNGYRRVRLTWRLLWDRRVSMWPKLIPIVALAYVISPLDLLPELALGPIGAIDDVMLLMLAVDQFMRFVPGELLLEHARDLGYADPPTLIEG